MLYYLAIWRHKIECSKQLQLECCTGVANAVLSCHVDTLLVFSKHLQFECCIRVANAILSCHIETLQECSKQHQFECCIKVVNALLSCHLETQIERSKTPSIRVLYRGWKCPIILPYG